MARRPIEERKYAKAMDDEGGANQSDRETTNINSIIAQHQATGIYPGVTRQNPLYGDFTGPMDLATHQARVISAREHFEALPAEIRKACDNDPVVFMEMVQDDNGLKLLTDLGLIVSEEPETPPSEPAASEKNTEEPEKPAASEES